MEKTKKTPSCDPLSLHMGFSRVSSKPPTRDCRENTNYKNTEEHACIMTDIDLKRK